MPISQFLVAAFLGTGLIAGCAEAGPSVTAQAGANIQTGRFDSVELHGGGHIVLRHGASERVTLLAGSTQYTRIHVEDGHKLVIDACNSDCPNQYDLEIDIVTPDIKGVAIEGGGHIETAPGFPAQGMIAAAVDGGGHIDLGNIDVKTGTAAVHGGGHIQIRVESVLTAAVEGGGAIRYWGNPHVMSAIDGGGSIRPDDGSRN